MAHVYFYIKMRLIIFLNIYIIKRVNMLTPYETLSRIVAIRLNIVLIRLGVSFGLTINRKIIVLFH